MMFNAKEDTRGLYIYLSGKEKLVMKPNDERVFRKLLWSLATNP